MDVQVLIKTDLNLLVTLYVVYEERSVSQASERLCVTQSAVSKSLSTARDLLGDPLLTRVGHKLVPTPYLENLAPQLISTLKSARSILQPEHFDPGIWHGEIRLALSEEVELVLLPRLSEYLQDNAPGISIETRSLTSDTLEQLSSGILDLAINLEYDQYHEDYTAEKLFSTYHGILGRRDHPLGNSEVSLAEAKKFPRFAKKIPDRDRIITYQEMAPKVSRVANWKIVFETESVLPTLPIIAATDCVIPVPMALAKVLLKEDASLRFFTMPEYQDLIFTYMIIAHQRTARSPVHCWLREIIKSLGDEIEAELTNN